MAEATISVLRFVLGKQEYGICTKQVIEVLRMVKITPLPTAPEFVEGVINRRGETTAVLNLRRKLGLKAAKPTSDSRIIVTEMEGSPVGIVVDVICDVDSVSCQDIDPPSSYPVPLDRDFVFGVAKTRDHPLILLNLEHIIAPEEKRDFSQIPDAQSVL